MVRRRWHKRSNREFGDERLMQKFVSIWRKSSIEELEICFVGVLSSAGLFGQVGADMNDVVGHDTKSDPPPDAVRSSVQRSPQPMPPFENTDAAFAAGAPFLKVFEPPLLLPLFARGTFCVMARDRDPADPHLPGLGFVRG